MKDIRDDIFQNISHRRITAVIIADDAGILAGTKDAKLEAKNLGLSISQWREEGDQVKRGDTVARFEGVPKQIAMAEDVLLGHISKPSGIATAARKYVEKAEQSLKIVCGAWKKMPICMKTIIRSAITVGGASVRISDQSFIYLDKNYIKMLGGITSSLHSVKNIDCHQRVVQLKGHFDEIGIEACEAAEHGAGIIFVDTGQISDVEKVINALKERGLEQEVQLAFAGGIRLEDIDHIRTLGIDILDVGRSIVDAPLLDMRMEVEDS